MDKQKGRKIDNKDKKFKINLNNNKKNIMNL